MPPIGSEGWIWASMYDAIAHCAVPIFLMISGTLFLGRGLSVSTLFQKYVKHFVIVYLFWSFLYALTYPDVSVKTVVSRTFTGGPRFDFLCYLAGLYVITPLLEQIIVSKKKTQYFLLLWFLFGVLAPQLSEFLAGRQSAVLLLLGSGVDHLSSQINLQFVMGVSGYYILGYVLSHEIILPKKKRRIIYAFGMFGAVVTVIGLIVDSILTEKNQFSWISIFSVNIVLLSVALFVFARYKLERIPVSVNIRKLINQISACGMGVYILHSFFLDQLLPDALNISANSWPAIIGVPVVAVIVFFFSLISALLLRRISFVKRYLL